MKSYGNEGLHHTDDKASTKDGIKPGNLKTISRRIAKKTRRAQDKANTRNEV